MYGLFLSYIYNAAFLLGSDFSMGFVDAATEEEALKDELNWSLYWGPKIMILQQF